MPTDLIYLDHNATAPMLREVADAVREASLRYVGNPASQHDAGRQARRALEAARQRIGEILGARTSGMEADRVIFTSGGTESNNLALHGLLGIGPYQPEASAALGPPAASGPMPIRRDPRAKPDPRAEPGAEGELSVAWAAEGQRPRLIVSAIEHPSVAGVAARLASRGCPVDKLGVDEHGVIRLDELPSLLDESQETTSARRPSRGGVVASIMLANNETGVMQPVADAARLCHERGAIIHTDATQAVGKLPVSFQELGVDAMTAAAHKFHGPLGIGVLIATHRLEIDPLLTGGFQQGASRPGTESVALAIGMETALEAWLREKEARQQRMTALREEFEGLIRAGYSEAVVIGAEAPRLPHTSNIALVGLDRQALVMALDLAGVACSTGSACASGSSEPSGVLLAMGLPAAVVSSAVRFSLGATTTAADIGEAASRILSVCNRLRRQI